MIANGAKPGRGQRTQQEVRHAQDQVGQRKGPAKAQPVSDGPSKGSQEPDQATKQASQAAGLLHREPQGLVQIAGQRSESGVVGQPFKQLRNVRYPKWAFEAGFYVIKPLGKRQAATSLSNLKSKVLNCRPSGVPRVRDQGRQL